MVTEVADPGRWCALDSIKAAQNSALRARTAAHTGRYVHRHVSVWRGLAEQRPLRYLDPRGRPLRLLSSCVESIPMDSIAFVARSPQMTWTVVPIP